MGEEYYRRTRLAMAGRNTPLPVTAQARIRVSPLGLAGAAFLRSNPHTPADVTFPCTRVCSVIPVKSGARPGRFVAREHNRLEDCGREPPEAYVPGTYAWTRFKSIPWLCCSAPLCFCRRGLVSCGVVIRTIQAGRE